MNVQSSTIRTESIPKKVKRLLGKNKLVTNASIYVAGTILQKALSFLLIPLYITYLTPEDFGIVGLGTAVSGVLGLVVGLGIYSAVARYYHDYRTTPDALRGYLTTNILFVAATTLAFSLILDRAGKPFWEMMTSGNVPFSPYVTLMIWGAASNVLVQVPLILYQTAQRPIAFVTANISLFLATLIFTIYFVAYQDMGAYGQLLGHFLATILAAVILIVLALREQFSSNIRWEYIQKSLLYSLPLVPHMVAGWAMNAIDRILLESGVSLAELGVYNLAYQLGMIMAVLVHAVHQAWLPYYYHLMKNSTHPESEIRRIILFYVSGLGGLSLLISLFGPEIIIWLAPDKYLGAIAYIPLISFAYLLQGFYYFASSPLFYYKATRILPLITISAAVLNIVLNLLWIPKWGAFGSAWATTLAFAVLFIAAYFLGRRYQRLDLPALKLLVVVCLIVIGTLFSTYSGSYLFLSSSLTAGLKLALLSAYTAFAVVWFALPAVRRKHIQDDLYVHEKPAE